jgi:methylmalonyl-CoA mutase N-terminal domain/subunit
LTKDVEDRAQKLLARIRELGGVVPALEKGFFHREIAETAYRHETDLAAGKRRIVGVNVHESEHVSPPILKIDHAVEKGQVRRLKKLRRDRDNGRVQAALARLRSEAKGTTNLMPAILEAVEAYATVGEVTNALKDVFGEYPVFGG